MKLKIIICIILFSYACENPSETNKNVIKYEIFQEILKEVHLAESEFRLSKSINLEEAQNKLTKDYNEIFKKYNIHEDDFRKSIYYYSDHPELLYEIYSNLEKSIKKD